MNDIRLDFLTGVESVRTPEDAKKEAQVVCYEDRALIQDAISNHEDHPAVTVVSYCTPPQSDDLKKVFMWLLWLLTLCAKMVGAAQSYGSHCLTSYYVQDSRGDAPLPVFSEK
ncbi:hypothetical protein F442_00391 [Phytophthora nicotianae P10297]|uniref:Uncharacterized protein n=2 Tax=Phytophthora nicotianae TaxID=4792 RepID=W3A6Y4_PHYNI|nr:hypothetical protein F442_00391 [Phytophthora nicotianae P10297]